MLNILCVVQAQFVKGPIQLTVAAEGNRLSHTGTEAQAVRHCCLMLTYRRQADSGKCWSNEAQGSRLTVTVLWLEQASWLKFSVKGKRSSTSQV